VTSLAATYAGCPFDKWSVKMLKEYLIKLRIDFTGALEKSDLVDACRSTTWPLPEKIREEDSAHECPICCDYRIDAVLSPCGHQACSVCTYEVQICPFCIAVVRSRMRTFR
jgi:hypothetical protein